MTDSSGKTIVTYTYDADGRLITKDLGNSTRTVYTYDADGNVLSITNYAPDHVTVNSFDDYTYDVTGNVLTDTSQDGEWAYTYDAIGELILAIFTPNSTGPDGLTSQNLQFVYDAAGNRMSERVNGVMTAYVVNDMNEYTSSNTVGVGTTTYQYDGDGNLISQTDPAGNMTAYTFNVQNQLIGINGPGVSAIYSYDPFQNLASQTVNSVSTRFQTDPTGAGERCGQLQR